MAPKRAGKARPKCDVEKDEDPNDMDDGNPFVEICLTSHTGFGLFAKKDIKRGTRILCEAPFIIIKTEDTKTPLDLFRRLEQLSSSELDAFYNFQYSKKVVGSKTSRKIRETIIASGKLYQCPMHRDVFIEAVKHRYGIFRTNATFLSREKGFAIFSIYSRMNHSCTPDVYATYNRSLDRFTVHAIRDIKAGEEIYTAYVDCARPIKIRTAALATKGVDCYCEACDDDDENDEGGTADRAQKNRERLSNITRGLEAYESKAKNAKRIVNDRWIPDDATDAFRQAEQRVYLLKEEGLLGMELAVAYRQCSRYCIQLGLIDEAKSYAKLELEVERYCLGVETDYMCAGGASGKDGGNAERWMKHVEGVAEKEKVKIQTKSQKEQKKSDKKAAKKNGKR